LTGPVAVTKSVGHRAACEALGHEPLDIGVGSGFTGKQCVDVRFVIFAFMPNSWGQKPEVSVHTLCTQCRARSKELSGNVIKLDNPNKLLAFEPLRQK
jgi:hypothetical protein